jgi:RNA polymerase sigma-70 factor (ECF subfamily)
VLRWQATEVADLLDTTVAAVNSALQRARATMATIGGDADALTEVEPARRELLARYVDAFERYDIEQLVTLLRADAVQSMPPYAMWLQGAEDIGRFMVGPGIGCRGSRLIPLSANGSPAFGHYKADPAGGHTPWALVVLEISGDRVAGIHSFLDVEQLFPAFGLPPHLPVEPRLGGQPQLAE